jgi:hypothetical protein
MSALRGSLVKRMILPSSRPEAAGIMRPSPWRSGEVYRCLNPQCECEIQITRLPRSRRSIPFLPRCSSCGIPMQRAVELEESP